MPIPSRLQRKLEETLGPEAEDLVSWMDSVDNARADIAELRHEMQVGFGRMDTKFAEMEATIERRTADLMKWSFGFWIGAVVAIAVLARLIR